MSPSSWVERSAGYSPLAPTILRRARREGPRHRRARPARRVLARGEGGRAGREGAGSDDREAACPRLLRAAPPRCGAPPLRLAHPHPHPTPSPHGGAPPGEQHSHASWYRHDACNRNCHTAGFGFESRPGLRVRTRRFFVPRGRATVRARARGRAPALRRPAPAAHRTKIDARRGFFACGRGARRSTARARAAGGRIRRSAQGEAGEARASPHPSPSCGA